MKLKLAEFLLIVGCLLTAVSIAGTLYHFYFPGGFR